MKLEGVKVFVAVADAGSISAAARLLRLSKSVVSERLSELERALGTNLVQRNARRLSLTEDGKAFRERANRITREASLAVEEIAERRNAISGHLTLAAPKAFGDLHLAPALYSFLRLHPEVTLTVDFDDRFAESASGYDAILRVSIGEKTKARVHPLTVSRRVFVAAPSYLAKYGRPGSPTELKEHLGVHFLERSPDDWTGQVGGMTVVSQVVPRLRVNSCMAMLGAAVDGLGIAFLPTFLVHEAVADGKLEALDIGTDPDISEVYLVQGGETRPSAKLRALIGHLRASFGNPPYWDRADASFSVDEQEGSRRRIGGTV